jgi:hypothetical protein
VITLSILKSLTENNTRAISMMLGRPVMTQHSTIPLPEAIDDEYLQPSFHCCQQPENTISKTEFYIQTLGLYKILREILSKVYGLGVDGEEYGLSKNKNNESSRAQVLMELDSELLNFKSNLPLALRWNDNHQDMETAKAFCRESSLIQARLAIHIPAL